MIEAGCNGVLKWILAPTFLDSFFIYHPHLRFLKFS